MTRNSNHKENHYFWYAVGKEDRSLRSLQLFVTKAFLNSRAEYFEGKLDFMIVAAQESENNSNPVVVLPRSIKTVRLQVM